MTSARGLDYAEYLPPKLADLSVVLCGHLAASSVARLSCSSLARTGRFGLFPINCGRFTHQSRLELKVNTHDHVRDNLYARLGGASATAERLASSTLVAHVKTLRIGGWAVKSIVTILVTMLITMLAGCMTAPLAPSVLDATAKEFVPQANKAALYIYRDDAWDIPMNISVNGILLGTTTANTYISLNVAPGTYIVESPDAFFGQRKWASLTLKVEAGKNYFILMETKMGLISNKFSLRQTDESTGRSGVLRGSLMAFMVGGTGVPPLDASSSAMLTTGTASGTSVTEETNRVQMPHYSFTIPPRQNWTMQRTDDSTELVVLSNKIGSTLVQIKLFRNVVLDQKMRTETSAVVADDFRRLEEQTMIELGVNRGQYALNNLVKAERTLGDRTFYTMTYDVVKNSGEQHAALYLLFPKSQGNDSFITAHYSETIPRGASLVESYKSDFEGLLQTISLQ
jgi:hypothetical protein